MPWVQCARHWHSVSMRPLTQELAGCSLAIVRFRACIRQSQLLLLTGAMHVQEAQAAHLQKELSDGLLCAVINNNTRCYNESTEFADHLDDALAGPYKVRQFPCSS